MYIKDLTPEAIRALIGQSTGRMIEVLTVYCRENASRFALEQVFLYGSRAHKVSRPDSDMDIAILFADSAGGDALFERLTEISLELTRLLGIEVNAILLARDFRHPMLFYNAIVHGIPVFVLDPAKHVTLKLEALHQMEDFSLFGTDWQREAARRNLEVAVHG